MKHYLATATLMLLLSGCAHTVEYDLTRDDKVMGRRINRVVEVKKFTDKIPPRREGVVKIDEAHWRTNPERGYTGDDAAYSITGMIARHLDHSELFNGVIYKGGYDNSDAPPGESQWVLTGTIAEYSVMGRINRPAEAKETAAGFFGLIGMAAGAVANLYEVTEIRVKITLKNVELRDAKTRRLLWGDTLTLTRTYEADFEDAGARAVYDNADACLKELVSEMIVRMEKKLRAPPPPRIRSKKR